MKERHKESIGLNARATLNLLHVHEGQDFHTLSSEQVDKVLTFADQAHYQKPKNANGSRARYFYARLQRQAALRVLILTLFMLGALATGAHAASVAPNLPDAPKPHIDRIQWSLFAAHAGFRVLDVYSTHQAIGRGYREIVLPRAIGEHTGPMIAYSAGTVAADYFAGRYLIRHHHPTMAKVLTSIDIAQDAPWAIHNLMLKKVGPR